jgi:hypothetical protein
MTYTHTPQLLKVMGEELWGLRWKALISPDLQLRVQPLALDMNQDGWITISDTQLWGWWLYSMPGDYAVIAAMKWAPRAVHFLETGPELMGGVISSLISIFAWLIVWLTATACRERLGRLADG